MWSCHLSSLVLAAGLFLRRPVLAGIAMMWVAVGFPTWVVASVENPDFFQPTSILTHGLGLALAIVAVRSAGMPRGTWWRALVLLIALWFLTRLVLPLDPEANVNITVRHWFGWEADLMSFPVYVGLIWAISGALFYGIERGARALGWREE
jgi:hypothetical protein